MKKTDKEYELLVYIPEGCKLVGCRTEGNEVVIVYADKRGPEVRMIGYCREHPGEVAGDENTEE